MKDSEFNQPLVIGDQRFLPGEEGVVELPIGQLVTNEMVHLTVWVKRGSKPGPRLLICGAVHGDEVNGVEVVRRVLVSKRLQHLSGDLIAVPVVNRPAFLARSRYLPDRKDLNRLFPGAAKGSFGARLAHVIKRELAAKCSHGIDFHTGAEDRPNVPQIRVSSHDPALIAFAKSFGSPIIIVSSVRDGSLRSEFTKAGKPMLMFEGGEASIVERMTVYLGVKGTFSAMEHLGMLPGEHADITPHPTVICSESWWERAPHGGVLSPAIELGWAVEKGRLLGRIGDPFSGRSYEVRSNRSGIVIGRTKQAVVDQGDALFHLAAAENLAEAEQAISSSELRFNQQFDVPVFAENEEGELVLPQPPAAPVLDFVAAAAPPLEQQLTEEPPDVPAPPRKRSWFRRG